MATIRLVPSTYYLSNSTYLSVSNANNMYANTDSTTYGTCTHNNTQGSTYYLYLRGFNFSDVPSNAIVTDWKVKIKASATGHTTSTSTSYYMALYNGTVALMNLRATERLTKSLKTISFNKGSFTFDSIKQFGSSFGIRIPLRRASSKTADVVSIYGAEIEVTYTEVTPATVTSSIVGDGTISPSGVTSTYEGASYTLTIMPPRGLSDFTGYTVAATKNGVDITNDLVAYTPSMSIQTGYQYTYTVDGDATIAVTVTQNQKLYVKINGAWKSVKMYQKNGLLGWQKVADPTTVLSTLKKYKKEN